MTRLRTLLGLKKRPPDMPAPSPISYEALYRCTVGSNPDDLSLHVIVFSMDRAIQLHGLLESYFACATDAAPMTILYRATTPSHRDAYEQVRELHADRSVRFVPQDDKPSFRPLLLDILASLPARKVFFLVDDIIFVEPLELATFAAFDTRDYVPSLRLGSHLSRCYTLSAPQPLPRLTPIQRKPEGLLTWHWATSDLDWGYPLSVDGHFFGRDEIHAVLDATPFQSPNTLEANLQVHSAHFTKRLGVCYPKSRIINVPWNRVQSDVPNIFGAVHQDTLLGQWQAGYAIDVGAFRGFQNISCHQELDIRFKRRQTNPATSCRPEP